MATMASRAAAWLHVPATAAAFGTALGLCVLSLSCPPAAATCVDINLVNWKPDLKRTYWGMGSGNLVPIGLYDRESTLPDGSPAPNRKIVKTGTLEIGCDLTQGKDPLIALLHGIIERAGRVNSADICEGDEIDVGGAVCKIGRIDLK